ncbi:class I SAM-dependent methyltransferase [Streptomyces cyaneofuscatus]|uniref:class I SAM-dependent DNA methyltransferase n=1 Tax=Streptomyces cyaneofuscatus TaxID=66883 RepID=UPI00339DB55B
MHEAELAEIYDQAHRSRGKDYEGEAAQVTALIRERFPQAASLLDVACGSGAHLSFFQNHFGRVEGLELSESMLAVARERLSAGLLHQGDMRSFRLERTFDAVTCMFGSIGYMPSVADLQSALGCLARHTTPSGVVVVEPWWFAETFVDGYVSGALTTMGGRTIARVSHSVREGNVSRLRVHYVTASAEDGAQHFSETHDITLFSREDYRNAFAQAGLVAQYFEDVFSGRGLFVAVREGGDGP